MIYMGIPTLPMPLNNAYARRRGGGRFLTPAAAKYKEETTFHISRTYLNELRFFQKNKPYTGVVRFEFADPALLFIKSFPEKSENRYKKNDVGNRLKLFEDALADATGIDDAHNWIWMVNKAVGPKDYTHLWMWSTEDEPDPLNTFLTQLLDSQKR